MDLLERLKQETAAQHAAVEDVVPLTDPELDVETYGEYLKALHPFYAHVESSLRRVEGLDLAVPDLRLRWKLPLIEADLRELGRAAGPIGYVPLPQIRSLAQAMGTLYVLEGSTLGGQILVRSVRGRLGDRVGGALRFLTAYGPETGAMWQKLRSLLRLHIQSGEEQEAAIAAARDLFSAFHAWLQTRQAPAAAGARRA